MTTPFRSRQLAIREAECLARELLAHGQAARITVEEVAQKVASRAQTAPVGSGALLAAS